MEALRAERTASDLTLMVDSLTVQAALTIVDVARLTVWSLLVSALVPVVSGYEARGVAAGAPAAAASEGRPSKLSLTSCQE